MACSKKIGLSSDMGKLLSYTINIFFIIVCFVHIVKVMFMSAYPEFAQTKMYGRQLKDSDFPLAFIICVRQENISDTFRSRGYFDEEHFFSGQSLYNQYEYGWLGHYENGSSFKTFEGWYRVS